MCMSVLLKYISVHLHVWCPERPEVDVKSSETGVTDSCELPCEYWELKTDPLEDQPVFLTAEPFLQSLECVT